MPTLSKAPLIEVIVQVRWGAFDPGKEGEPRFSFAENEDQFFPGLFRSVVEGAGYTGVERINADASDVVHVPTWRFVPQSKAQPIYQIGLGILTINQPNDGYEWKSYKEGVIQGLEYLRQAQPSGAGLLPFIGIELVYLDGFPFEKGETLQNFLRNKLTLQLFPPREFLDAPFLKPDLVTADVSFALEVAEPEGVLILDLEHGSLFGKPGVLMSSAVRSVGTSLDYTPEGIPSWLEAAHRVQQHAFKHLIQPAYHRSFQ